MEKNRSEFFRFLRKSYHLTLLGGLFLSVFTVIFSPWIIKLLSKSYLEESILYLRLLGTLPFLASLNVANTTLLLVLDLKALLFRASWMMCIYMLSVSILLTYFFGGVGLALSIISTEIIVFLICSVLIFRYDKKLIYECYF
jgi:PST family polysaccharide transporter